MTQQTRAVQLHRPWLVAVWPGMGNVALNAGVYLLAKLNMSLIAEYETGELFDVDHVAVEKGLIQMGRRPRNRFFVWRNPAGAEGHDLVVFLGEAQPPLGKQRFCQQLIAYARELGIERVFTFAAMATQMRPEHTARVFGAATDPATLVEIRKLDLELLEDGNISGLNGVLLGAAAQEGLRGACFLGEIPHIFAQLPFPKASLAVLEVFTRMTSIELDLTELSEQAAEMEERLGELLQRVEDAYGPQLPESGAAEEEGFRAEPVREEKLSPADRQRIEALFKQTEADRSKAFELKRELDRLGAFKEYEDRFLDLFKSSG